MVTKLPIPERLVYCGEHSGPFPPSYYSGIENADRRLYKEVSRWCLKKFGYSPICYWGSDANDDDDLDVVTFDGWVAFFHKDSHAVEFVFRWHNHSLTMRELLDFGSVDVSHEFTEEEIYRFYDFLKGRNHIGIDTTTINKYLAAWCDDWRVSIERDTIKIKGCMETFIRYVNQNS